MFVILAGSDPDKVAAVIAEKYPNDFLMVAPGQWLVAGDGTAQEVSNNLGITDGTNGSGLVLSFQTYFGRSKPQNWEWIADKMGGKRG